MGLKGEAHKPRPGHKVLKQDGDTAPWDGQRFSLRKGGTDSSLYLAADAGPKPGYCPCATESAPPSALTCFYLYHGGMCLSVSRSVWIYLR